MFVKIRILFVFILLIILSPLCNLKAQLAEGEADFNSANWNKIKPFFSPPKEYAEKYGEFRSPLLFYNGDSVKFKKDWTKRREEIRTRWHKMMGSWPALITNQELEFLETNRKENFTQHRVRFNWLPEKKTEGYLLVPDKKGTKPAVVIVYYEPESAVGMGKPYRDFAYQLTKRGYVTLSIGTSEATKKQVYSLYYPDIKNAQVQPLSMLAYAAANAWNVLSKVTNVDSTRIGIMGHSFGGKWAMFASCLYEKFACSVWSDPGIVFDESRPNVNYWEPWYLGYQPQRWRKRSIIAEDNPAQGLYPKLIANGFDLTDLHALMAPRPFLVSGGSEDQPERWLALNHSIAVNNLLDFPNRVAMTNRAEHSPDEESNEQAYLFFDYFLQPSINF